MRSPLTRLAALVLCLLAAPSLFAASPSPTPAPVDQYLVLMQTGVYDATVPHPVVPNCFGGACDGQYFQEEILGRTPAEIAAEEASAKAFFLSQFGLDADDPELAGRVFFFPFMLDPRGDYRVYTMGGRKVPAEGWQVWDGGFSIVVIDPDGLDVPAGPYAGVHMTPGSFVVQGNYDIIVTGPNGKPTGEEIVLSYRSEGPVVVNFEGTHPIRCRMEHPEWGVGLGQGSFNGTILPDGRFQATLRNILTFPAPPND